MLFLIKTPLKRRIVGNCQTTHFKIVTSKKMKSQFSIWYSQQYRVGPVWNYPVKTAFLSILKRTLKLWVHFWNFVLKLVSDVVFFCAYLIIPFDTKGNLDLLVASAEPWHRYRAAEQGSASFYVLSVFLKNPSAGGAVGVGFLCGFSLICFRLWK